MRLSPDTLDALSQEVARTDYDRTTQAVGVVHIGIGAFHRAHQAWYLDRVMAAGERGWAVLGVSLRSATVAGQLNPQDGLFTVTERSAAGEATRLVGSVRKVLVASRDRQAVIAALAAPATRIVSLSVTEKGYCRAADGSLDMGLAGAGSFYPLLGEALRRRHDAGFPGLTLLSCDNLAENGRKLDALMQQWLEAHDPALAGWFRAECACPSTMVDRIVPATTEADRQALATRIGLDDRGAVMTEPFSQWVIEDRFAAGRPRLEAVGAELVGDVRPYETAKLRMLNAAHSLLAYAGLARGHTYVHQAIGDPHLRALVERLMLEEAAPTIAAAPGQNLVAYANRLIARFANPALNHRLAQIAMDGSQKIPQRWLETLAENRRMGRECPAILAGLAAWMAHVQAANGRLEDPLAAPLAEVAHKAGSAGLADALFGGSGPLGPGWLLSESERAMLKRCDLAVSPIAPTRQFGS